MVDMKPKYYFAALTALACKEHQVYTAGQNSNLEIKIIIKIKKNKTQTPELAVTRLGSSATIGNVGTYLWVVQVLRYL